MNIHPLLALSRAAIWSLVALGALLPSLSLAGDVMVAGIVFDADTFVAVKPLPADAPVQSNKINVKISNRSTKKFWPTQVQDDGSFRVPIPAQDGILQIDFGEDLTTAYPQRYLGIRLNVLVAGDGNKLNVALVSVNSKSRNADTDGADLIVKGSQFRPAFYAANVKSDEVRAKFASAIEGLDRTRWRNYDRPPYAEFDALVQEVQSAKVTPPPVFSPDSKSLIAPVGGGKWSRLPINADGLLGNPFWVSDEDFKPGGKLTVLDSGKLLTTGIHGLHLFDTDGEHPPKGAKALRPDTGRHTALTRTADGKTFASGDAAGVVTVSALTAGGGAKVVRTLHFGDSPVRDLAFSADGSRLTAANAAGTVIAWDVASGAEVLHPKQFSGQVVNVVRFAPDAESVLVGTGLVSKGEVSLVKEVGEPKRLLTIPDGAVGSLGLTADNKELLVGSAQAGTIFVYDYPSRGGAMRGPRKTLKGFTGLLSLSPNRDLIGLTGKDGKPVVKTLPQLMGR